MLGLAEGLESLNFKIVPIPLTVQKIEMGRHLVFVAFPSDRKSAERMLDCSLFHFGFVAGLRGPADVD